jgi:hypothetical protein
MADHGDDGIGDLDTFEDTARKHQAALSCLTITCATRRTAAALPKKATITQPCKVSLE